MNFDIFEKINRKIPSYLKICVISGLLTGGITHFYIDS